MPHYEIFYTYDGLGKRPLAEAITALHCSTFSAPSIFVNVTFHYYSPGIQISESNYIKTVFVGGKEEVQTNYIIGHLRPRGQDNRAKLIEITKGITQIWNEFAKPDQPGSLSDPKALHNIFIMEDIAAGAEQGFILPVAGEDAKWAEENMGEFQRRAGEGDESMARMVEEVKRGLEK